MDKNCYIFIGPTISVQEAALELDAIYLPPVAQGDVYRVVVEKKPKIIGIVDGVFERVPSVWHKEILFALNQGIHVLGSSSLGALRAAELEAFGVEGIGKIFQAYRDGDLEDDDEVALLHSDGDNDFRPLSEPMVNIRASLRQAVGLGLVTPSCGQELENIAKSLFYADRSYQKLLYLAKQRFPTKELSSFEVWLSEGNQVNQKKEDAIELLRTIKTRLAAGIEPKQVTFHFEHTILWEMVILQQQNQQKEEAIS